MNKIKLKSESVITHKLHFVKLIKDYTDLGLKEAKFVCDNLCENIGNSEEIVIRKNKNTIDFVKEINNTFSGQVLVWGGTEVMREHNLLIIGIGEKEDYINHILEWANVDKRNDILLKCLNFLDKEQLQEILSDVKIFGR